MKKEDKIETESKSSRNSMKTYQSFSSGNSSISKKEPNDRKSKRSDNHDELDDGDVNPSKKLRSNDVSDIRKQMVKLNIGQGYTVNISQLIKEINSSRFLSETIPKKIILILGLTGSGKSTVSNIICNKDFVVQKTEMEKILQLKDPHSGVSLIYHGISSGTTVPNRFDAEGMAFYDCPGFHDTRNPEQEIKNAFFIKYLLDNAKEMKFIVVIESRDLTSKGNLFKNLCDSIEGIFNWKCGPETGVLDGKICLVVTKVSADCTKEDVAGVLVKIANNTENSVFGNTVLKAIRDDAVAIIKQPSVQLAELQIKKLVHEARSDIIFRLNQINSLKNTGKEYPPVVSTEAQNYARDALEMITKDQNEEMEEAGKQYFQKIIKEIQSITQEIDVQIKEAKLEELKEKNNCSSTAINNTTLANFADCLRQLGMSDDLVEPEKTRLELRKFLSKLVQSKTSFDFTMHKKILLERVDKLDQEIKQLKKSIAAEIKLKHSFTNKNVTDEILHKITLELNGEYQITESNFTKVLKALMIFGIDYSPAALEILKEKFQRDIQSHANAEIVDGTLKITGHTLRLSQLISKFQNFRSIEISAHEMCFDVNLRIPSITLVIKAGKITSEKDRQYTIDLSGLDGENGTPGTDAKIFVNQGAYEYYHQPMDWKFKVSYQYSTPGGNGNPGKDGGNFVLNVIKKSNLLPSKFLKVILNGGRGGNGGNGGNGHRPVRVGVWQKSNLLPSKFLKVILNGGRGGNGGNGGNGHRPVRVGAWPRAKNGNLDHLSIGLSCSSGGIGGQGGHGGTYTFSRFEEVVEYFVGNNGACGQNGSNGV